MKAHNTVEERREDASGDRMKRVQSRAAAQGKTRKSKSPHSSGSGGSSKRAGTSPVSTVVRKTIMERQVQFQSSD